MVVLSRGAEAQIVDNCWDFTENPKAEDKHLATYQAIDGEDDRIKSYIDRRSWLQRWTYRGVVVFQQTGNEAPREVDVFQASSVAARSLHRIRKFGVQLGSIDCTR